jgi:hypothetical protein
MAIVDLLAAAQGGQFFANAGRVTGLTARDAEMAVASLAPAIAAKLKDKAGSDPEAFDQLLDLLEEGGDSSDLDDAEAMTGEESLADGKAILSDLYGSTADETLGKLAPHVKGPALEKISAISATSVLAALAASNASTLASPAAESSGGGGGIISVIIAALLKGLMQGASRQLAPRRRRRRYSYGYRRPTRRRRTRRPGLDDVFKDILGGRR